MLNVFNGTSYIHSQSESDESISSSPCENANQYNQNLLFLHNFNNIFTLNTILGKQNENKEYKRRRSNKSKFTIDEDNLLLNLVSKYGEKNWKKIAAEFDGRSVRQCRDRYRHYLSPDLNKKDWTEDEDDLLMEKVEEIGGKWKKLEQFFINRNEVQIRNRYYQITHKNSRDKNKNKKQITSNVQCAKTNSEIGMSLIDANNDYFKDYDAFENESEFEIEGIDYM